MLKTEDKSYTKMVKTDDKLIVEKPVEITIAVRPEPEEQETSNDICEMLNLYRKYENQECGREDEHAVEIYPEYPVGIAQATHPSGTPCPEIEETGVAKSTEPRNPDWACYWDRDLLRKNRDGKGLKQLTELTVKRYEGSTERIFEKFGSVTFTSGITYQGPFDSQRKATGIGRLIFPDGTIFDGEVQDSEVGRRGIYRWSDGSVYEGNLREGMRHGYGRFFDAASGSFYSGSWHYAHMHDYGKMVFYGSDKNFYQGSWTAGVQWGHGLRQWPSGNFYEGQWARGLPHGRGCKFWLGHHIYLRGEFEEGVPHGFGLMIWIDRHAPADGAFSVLSSSGITIECFYIDDSLHDPMKKYLLKESKETCYLVPLPSPCVRQIDYAPNYDPAVSAIAMPATVFFLSEKFGLSNVDVADEIRGISSVMASYLEALKDVYSVYSRLMVETSCDHVYVLRAFQYWQFLTDVVLERGTSGVDVQQGLFHLLTAIESCFDGDKRRDVFCHPYQPIKPSEFFDRITVAAYLVKFQKQDLKIWREKEVKLNAGQSGEKVNQEWPFKKDWDISGRPLKRLIETRIFQRSGQFHSSLFDDPRKCPIVFRYISQLHRIFRYIYEFYGSQEELMPEAMTVQALVTAMKDSRIVGTSSLSYTELLRIFETKYPDLRKGNASFSLLIPLTLLEFVELIFDIALTYKGDFPVTEKGKSTHGRKPTTFKGRIAEAVDSLVIAAHKNPFLTKDNSVDIDNYDPDFFSMLRGERAVAQSMSSGDAADPSLLIRSRQSLFDWDYLETTAKASNSEQYEYDPANLTVHPPEDPSDYEYPDCELPAGSEFKGFTLDNTRNISVTTASKALNNAELWPSYLPPQVDAENNKGKSSAASENGPRKQRLLTDVPSMETVKSSAPICSVTSLLPTPTLAAWEKQAVPFLEHVFFPNMILLKRTNDLLIQHGHARQLEHCDAGDLGLTDCIAEALLDGDAFENN
ncbi:putative Radial spoke head 10-like protein B [Hypsibius exemplaris]|uniref:Radial spoke head 10-like protein B n=1 Tax=Hypsibius exemplaris TaxID=2072580 RepID=A0A1W0WFU6_HYPEX|nr:putative Radial spoke head 10-like protein B [Hypsibius exemplaris]